MSTPPSSHALYTKLSLRAPLKVEVPLVPLTTFQVLEFQFSWFTVFLALCTTFLGALISSVSAMSVVSFSTFPWLLLITTLIFAAISLFFGRSSMSTHRELLSAAEEPAGVQFKDFFESTCLALYSLKNGAPVPIGECVAVIKAHGVDVPEMLLRDLEQEGFIKRVMPGGILHYQPDVSRIPEGVEEK